MAFFNFPATFLAESGGGLLYAYEKSTLPGKIVLLALFVASVLSWTVMVSKFRLLKRARARRTDFIDAFRGDRQPLSLYQSGARFAGAPIFTVYQAGCRELCFQMLGSSEVDETFAARLETSPRISPAQMRMVQTAMERAVGESALKLESQMVLLSTAVSGAPFLGLLGTVWGVMETFGDVAQAGKASLTAMAPGVSAALITTVTGLLVAIPAMFGYNWLVTTLRGMVVELDNFSAELSSAFEHKYVDHGERRKLI
jgi:biopolymer transport protein TolQ